MIDKNPEETEIGITPKQLKRYAPKEREEKVKSILLEILEKNPNGITVPQLMEITKFDRRTIRKHMEYLTAIREAYLRNLGTTTLFYPNGRVVHPTIENDFKIGNKYFSFSFIENPFGQFLYIQEKSRDEYTNTYTVKGGIVLQAKHLMEFIQVLEKINEEAEKWKK